MDYNKSLESEVIETPAVYSHHSTNRQECEWLTHEDADKFYSSQSVMFCFNKSSSEPWMFYEGLDGLVEVPVFFNSAKLRLIPLSQISSPIDVGRISNPSNTCESEVGGGYVFIPREGISRNRAFIFSPLRRIQDIQMEIWRVITAWFWFI